MMEIINKDMKSLQELATLFYQGSYIKGFDSMQESTEQILAIIDNLVKLSETDPTKPSIELNYVNAALTEIMNAYENRDGILIADLLTFELLDHFNSVLEQWSKQ